MADWSGPGISRRALIGATAAAPFGGCGLSDENTGVYRARLTLSINTPSGLRQASTVVEAKHGAGWAVGRGQVSSAQLRGQAAFLDMGEGRHLIMLLGHDSGYGIGQNQYHTDMLVIYSFRGHGDMHTLDPENPRRRETPIAGKTDLHGLLLPIIGRFRDLNDPFSWETVYWVGITNRDRDPTNGKQLRAPYVVIDTIASIYGQGHSFGSVTLEIVNAGIWPLSSLGIFGSPISTGIEEKVPWLKTPRLINDPKLSAAQQTFLARINYTIRRSV